MFLPPSLPHPSIIPFDFCSGNSEANRRVQGAMRPIEWQWRRIEEKVITSLSDNNRLVFLDYPRVVY